MRLVYGLTFAAALAILVPSLAAQGQGQSVTIAVTLVLVGEDPQRDLAGDMVL